MRKILYTCLTLTLLAGCAQTANQIAGTPPRPRISAEYQKMLMLNPVTAKMAIQHEYDWHAWADKMSDRIK